MAAAQRNPLHDVASSMGKTLGVTAGFAVILAAALVVSNARYGGIDFTTRHVPTWAVLAAGAGIVTLSMRRPAEIGVRLPTSVRYDLLAPIVVIALITAIAFAVSLSTVPAGNVLGADRLPAIFVASLLAAIGHEWLFRGLLLTAFVSRVGPLGGALITSAAFGALHGVYALAGQSVREAVLHIALATLLGLALAAATLATRSILPAVVGHAVFDFFVVSGDRLDAAGADVMPLAAASIVATVGASLAALEMLRRPVEPTSDANARHA